MQQKFTTPTITAAVQILDYAKSQGIDRKSADITERGDKTEVHIDFGNADDKRLEQVLSYATSVGAKVSSS